MYKKFFNTENPKDFFFLNENNEEVVGGDYPEETIGLKEKKYKKIYKKILLAQESKNNLVENFLKNNIIGNKNKMISINWSDSEKNLVSILTGKGTMIESFHRDNDKSIKPKETAG